MPACGKPERPCRPVGCTTADQLVRVNSVQGAEVLARIMNPFPHLGSAAQVTMEMC